LEKSEDYIADSAMLDVVLHEGSDRKQHGNKDGCHEDMASEFAAPAESWLGVLKAHAARTTMKQKLSEEQVRDDGIDGATKVEAQGKVLDCPGHAYLMRQAAECLLLAAVSPSARAGQAAVQATLSPGDGRRNHDDEHNQHDGDDDPFCPGDWM